MEEYPCILGCSLNTLLITICLRRHSGIHFVHQSFYYNKKYLSKRQRLRYLEAKAECTEDSKKHACTWFYAAILDTLYADMILSPFMPQRYKKFSYQATFNAKK